MSKLLKIIKEKLAITGHVIVHNKKIALPIFLLILAISTFIIIKYKGSYRAETTTINYHFEITLTLVDQNNQPMVGKLVNLETTNSPEDASIPPSSNAQGEVTDENGEVYFAIDLDIPDSQIPISIYNSPDDLTTNLYPDLAEESIWLDDQCGDTLEPAPIEWCTDTYHLNQVRQQITVLSSS